MLQGLPALVSPMFSNIFINDLMEVCAFNILDIGQTPLGLPFDAYLQFVSWIIDSLSGACLGVHTTQFHLIFFFHYL